MLEIGKRYYATLMLECLALHVQCDWTEAVWFASAIFFSVIVNNNNSNDNNCDNNGYV